MKQVHVKKNSIVKFSIHVIKRKEKPLKLDECYVAFLHASDMYCCDVHIHLLPHPSIQKSPSEYVHMGYMYLYKRKPTKSAGKECQTPTQLFKIVNGYIS